MSRPSPATSPVVRRLVGALCLAAGLAGLALPPAAASAEPVAPRAVGDDVIAWVEVEDGVISGGPALNSGDHGNFSGTGSYTFRETGMTSTMSVTAPAAGVYPIHVRYAAGPLSAAENVTRSMGLLTNGGSRQLMSLPMTSFGDWETWRFVTYQVTLQQGANTVAVQCDRSTDFCRLNFDAIQVGGATPDPCPATPVAAGWSRMFDGTFESFDGWRKAGSGGFGRQTDCTIRSVRGRGATWFTQQRTAPYTLRLDWRRRAADDESSVYLGSSSRGGADPAGGFRIPIGTGTGAIVPTGGTSRPADAAAVAAALRPVGQWNTYTVQVTTSGVRLALNGTVVNTYDSPSPLPAGGFVGLENRGSGHDVDFRDISSKPGTEPDTRTIQVLGTNDFAGRLLADGPEAGAAVLAGAVGRLRADNPDTVFAAAGDLIGASTYESFVQQDLPTIDALDAAGLDVSAVGDHELDHGYADLVGRVAARADWEYVAANLRRRSDGSHAVAPSWTRTFGDVEVGFVGAVTEDLPALTPAAGISAITVTDVVDEVNAAADALEADGADVVVALVHEGAESTALASVTDDSAFGRVVTGLGSNVDAVISGHSRLAYDHAVTVPAWVAEGRAVTTRPVVSAGAHGTHLNQLEFTVDTATGEVTATDQALLPLVTTPAYPADAGAEDVVESAVAQAEVLGARALGQLAHPLARAPGGETALANLVAESQRWATRAREAGSAQLALVDPTSLAADLLGEPGGYPATLTHRQAARVQPEAERLVTTRLTGRQVEAVLEQQWRGAEGPLVRLGTSDGFSYTYDPVAPQGSRVTGMWLDGHPVVPSMGYSVTTTASLADGAAGFTALRDGTGTRDTGRTDLAALVDHLGAVAARGVVAGDPAQHAVGVSFPGGRPATYDAGSTLAVDLSSWAFAAASGPVDTEVRVALDGRPLGTFAVEATGDVLLDEQGTATVRATVPADTPAGPATVTFVGDRTGTTVVLPVTVSGSSEPPVRAGSATVVTTSPSGVTVGRGALVSISVASAAGTPTGDVEVSVGGAAPTTVTLVGGRAAARVGPFAATGTRAVEVRYLGDGATAPSTGTGAIRVVRAAPRLRVEVAPRRVEVRRTRATLRVAVAARGLAPRGRVLVEVAGSTYSAPVRRGVATVRLDRFTRTGRFRAVATYLGDSRVRPASTSTRVAVRPRR